MQEAFPPKPIRKQIVQAAAKGGQENADAAPADETQLGMSPLAKENTYSMDGGQVVSDPYLGSPAAPSFVFGAANPTASVAPAPHPHARRASPATPRTLYGSHKQRVPVKCAKAAATRPSPRTTARDELFESKRGMNTGVEAPGRPVSRITPQHILLDDDSDRDQEVSEASCLTTLE